MAEPVDRYVGVEGLFPAPHREGVSPLHRRLYAEAEEEAARNWALRGLAFSANHPEKPPGAEVALMGWSAEQGLG